MLGIIIGDNFSVAQHIQRLVTSSTQTHYALRVLRCHGPTAKHCGSAARLPSNHHRLSHVRRQRIEWFHQGLWTLAHRLSDGPRLTPWILHSGCTDVRWPVRQHGRWAIQQGSSLVEPRTACSAATVIRHVTSHNDTTSDNERTHCSCLSIRLSCLIVIFWYTCCTKHLLTPVFTYVLPLLLACIMSCLLINKHWIDLIPTT